MDTETLYDVAYWSAQVAGGLAFIHGLVNRKSFAGTLSNLPDRFAYVVNLLQRLGGLEIVGDLIPEDIWYKLNVFNGERKFLYFWTVICYAPLYFLFGVDFEEGDTGLPGINDSAEHTMTKVPGNWSFDHVQIFKTLGWWVGLIALIITKSIKPSFKYDEVTIAMILGWNFIFTWWDKEDFDFALGMFILQLPWCAFLWFMFDENGFESQGMLADEEVPDAE